MVIRPTTATLSGLVGKRGKSLGSVRRNHVVITELLAAFRGESVNLADWALLMPSARINRRSSTRVNFENRYLDTVLPSVWPTTRELGRLRSNEAQGGGMMSSDICLKLGCWEIRDEGSGAVRVRRP